MKLNHIERSINWTDLVNITWANLAMTLVIPIWLDYVCNYRIFLKFEMLEGWYNQYQIQLIVICQRFVELVVKPWSICLSVTTTKRANHTACNKIV